MKHWETLGPRAGGMKSFGIGLTRLRRMAKRIGRDHELIREPMLQHALDHPGDERLAGQKLKGFVGESGRAETGRDDTEDAHHGN